MEETVGAIWDKLISQLATQSHPQASVRLEDIRPLAAIFFRALGGDASLALYAGNAQAHGGRRTFLQRIAGLGEKNEGCYFNALGLCLPAKIDHFPEPDLNRDLYFWLIALAIQDADSDSDSNISKTRDTLTTAPPCTDHFLMSQTACRNLLHRFPALKPRYLRLVEAHIAQRPKPAQLRKVDAENEHRIQQALRDPGSINTPLRPSKYAPAPVVLWLHPSPLSINTKSSAPRSTTDTEENEATQGKSSTEKEARKRQAERTAMPDNPSPFMLLFRAESLFSWAEYVKVNRDVDEDDNPDAERAANDLDHLSVAHDGKSLRNRIRFDLDLPAPAEDDWVIADGIRYPEWHYQKQRYQDQHSCIQMMLARDALQTDLPPHLRATAQRLRRQFQALRPEAQRLRAQVQGNELDIDACVRQQSAPHQAWHTPQVYIDRRAQTRELACLLLADLSMSTDTWINNQSRIIDVIRDSLYLLCEALDASQDRFALYGFSSVRRQHVRMHLLKGFDERYGDPIRARLAALKPGFYTRMGAAIRHASALLGKQKCARRLLLILTDGKPNDLDQYESRYGIEDTRMAIHEARQMGLIPFCVTIDDKAADYLPHLFGCAGYLMLANATELPAVLPKLYTQITQNHR